MPKTCESTFLFNAPRLKKADCLVKVPRLCLFVLHIRRECRERWTMSTGRKKPTGENGSIWRKICPSATLSTKNDTWTGPGLNNGLCVKRLATNGLSHGTALKIKMDLLYIYSVYTLQRIWRVSTIHTNLWRRPYSERIAVNCENHTKHIGTLCLSTIHSF
jgi:hypothetical protein